MERRGAEVMTGGVDGRGARLQHIPLEILLGGSFSEFDDFHDGHDIREEERLFRRAWKCRNKGGSQCGVD